MAVNSIVVKNISNEDRLLTGFSLKLAPNEEQELVGLATVTEIARSEELSKLLEKKLISVQIVRTDGSVRFANSDGFEFNTEFGPGDDPSGPSVHAPLDLGDTPNGLQLDEVSQTLNLNAATPTTPGAMSAADKSKLDTLAFDTILKRGRLDAGNFAGSPKKANVVFSTNFPDTLYGVQIQAVNDERVFTYEDASVSGFTINTNANEDMTSGVAWLAISDGETTE